MVRFHPGASEDLDEGFEFYQKREPGLGFQLVDMVEECIARIVAAPNQWQNSGRGTKRCRVHRFPYDVIYKIVEDGIVIVAVMQLNRRPGYWKNRI